MIRLLWCGVLLESFAGHLQVVVPFSLGQLAKIHKARVLPLVVVADLRGGRGKKSWQTVYTTARNISVIPSNRTAAFC